MVATTTKRFDVFISHASEDKEDFVDSLDEALRAAGLDVWYDRNEIRIGDSIRGSIDLGLSESRYGVVVLSPAFMAKEWTKHELGGLSAINLNSILPVWHGVSREEVVRFSPTLADLAALDSSVDSISEIARKIADKVRQEESSKHRAQSESREQSLPEHGFAVFYIAPAGTPELPLGEEPELLQSILGGDKDNWNSMVSENEEIEYQIQGGKLRMRLDWGNVYNGPEIAARTLAYGSVPVSLLMRLPRTDLRQSYWASATPRQSGSFLSGGTRSGWLVFDIPQVVWGNQDR